MSLQNLLAIHRLQTHTPNAAAMRKLLEAARRNLADAGVAKISADNRFDAAYKCIMQCAMLGLWAQGYRTVTSQPGHHQTAIQSLGLTLGVAQADIVVLDALRRQRTTKATRCPPPRWPLAWSRPAGCLPSPSPIWRSKTPHG